MPVPLVKYPAGRVDTNASATAAVGGFRFAHTAVTISTSPSRHRTHGGRAARGPLELHEIIWSDKYFLSPRIQTRRRSSIKSNHHRPQSRHRRHGTTSRRRKVGIGDAASSSRRFCAPVSGARYASYRGRIPG
jgi:hypothetical protein